MAIRYVKDFEFPSAAGFSDSAPSKVTGPMFAKGGKVEAEKAPKGLMVIIGVGKPKGPMKKAEGGSTSTNPNLGPGPLQMPSDEQINKENWNERKAKRRAMGAKNTGSDTFKKGGKVDSVSVKDIKSGKVPQSTDEDFYGKAKDMPMPPRRPSMLKKGGMPHEDVKEDTALIKSMIKPSALKKAMGGPAVQMAKSNAIESSLRGQKKTGYADGGPMMHPPLGGTPASPDKMGQQYTPGQGSALQSLAANARQNVSPDQLTQMADAQRGKAALSAAQAAQSKSPLQQMGRSVPVAPRAPMIAQQVAAPGGARIGVGMRRPGQPNVGAIRAAMARSASQAMPENAPSMMKKGGKVKC